MPFQPAWWHLIVDHRPEFDTHVRVASGRRRTLPTTHYTRHVAYYPGKNRQGRRGTNGRTRRVQKSVHLRSEASYDCRIMEVRAADLRNIHLFRDIPDVQLTALLKIFTREKVPAAQILFREGDVATRLRLLVGGRVTLTEEGQAMFELHPLTLIGELGGLTGMPRNATATTATASEIWSVEGKKLTAFLEKNVEVAMPFYRNLLAAASGKIKRDKQRMDQMRRNIIRTQKSMKELRDLVLSKPETQISKPVCEALEDHIERNRRAGYRVSPTDSLPAFVKLDNGAKIAVLEISNGYMKLEGKGSRLTKDASIWVGVLALPLAEVAISGSLERQAADGVVVKLDTLLDDTRVAVETYVTQVQLMDFVV
jgi:CRP/FNR family transcriptional regulator, cyclic AMP receptor protein